MKTPNFEEPVPFSDRWDRAITIEQFHTRLQQAVAIHQVMFEKLLVDRRSLPLELAELLQDAGTTYLQFSKEIEQYHDRFESMLNSSFKPES